MADEGQQPVWPMVPIADRFLGIICPTCGAEMHPEHSHFHRSGYNATNFPPDVWPDPEAPWIWDRPPKPTHPTVDPPEQPRPCEPTMDLLESPPRSLDGGRPLRWERPRIVSTGSTAAGTPQPQGWEA